jgi:hypothetical protein
MPLIQGGPPFWVWERRPDPLKWEVLPYELESGEKGYAVRVLCNLEILRVQFVTADELQALASLITATLPQASQPNHAPASG